ncbi:MAG: saccharopine dehydrogenase [Rhodobacteraceae bacterium]|nr:MAG: saccharopine dehydrogenase [Paracoccaceae bacterium]
MGKIHWIGTGLSSIPGLRNILAEIPDVHVWNRTEDKAVNLVGDLSNNIHKFDLKSLQRGLSRGDIVVSMLPGEWHIPIAKVCIDHFAHFVSSSYISEEMQCLHEYALANNVTLMNEVGLDPGIDHLMAHFLVHDYKKSIAYDLDNEIDFVSYCGGIPKIPNEFCYKFSWSPTGVLKALKSKARSIKDFQELVTERPWHQVEHFAIPSEDREQFEVYPNRDSLPFIKQYFFEDDWKIKTFVRGTLRNMGWKKAWKEIFKEIDSLDLDKEHSKLQHMSERLWKANSYGENEPDRVVLNVSLKASKNGATRYEKSYFLDAWGDERGTAMARLVSLPVTLAIKEIIKGNIVSGVSAAPNSLKIVRDWLEQVGNEAQMLKLIDKS